MQNKCLLQEELQELLRALLKLDHSISRILTDDKHTDFVYLEDLKLCPTYPHSSSFFQIMPF